MGQWAARGPQGGTYVIMVVRQVVRRHQRRNICLYSVISLRVHLPQIDAGARHPILAVQPVQWTGMMREGKGTREIEQHLPELHPGDFDVGKIGHIEVRVCKRAPIGIGDIEISFLSECGADCEREAEVPYHQIRLEVFYGFLVFLNIALQNRRTVEASAESERTLYLLSRYRLNWQELEL